MDLKQLQYFVVCAQTGSFSDAAKNLYSTQPSVSKVIKGLEDTLGMQLFERLPRGIRLTVQGHKMYEYASKIINEVNVLENMASSGMTKWIRISLNPSSWFANQFVDFYNETYEKKYHFQVTTAGVQSVMERVRDYMDDIGFVYILSQQKENFLYELSKNKMHFEPIYETDVMLYPGRLTELYNSGKERAELEDLEGIRFIQNYQDEFFDADQGPEMVDKMIGNEKCRALLKEIDEMPKNWKEIVVLKMLEGRPTEEVCSILNISEKACYSRIARIRKYLDKLIKDDNWP